MTIPSPATLYRCLQATLLPNALIIVYVLLALSMLRLFWPYSLTSSTSFTTAQYGTNQPSDDDMADMHAKSSYYQPYQPSPPANCPYHDDENGMFHPNTPHPRFIVTGGAGFIGSHLVKRLVTTHKLRPSQVKVVDNLWRGRLSNLQISPTQWVIDLRRDFCRMDLRNEADVLKYIRGADLVYHLADIVAGVSYVFNHELPVFHDNMLINTYTLRAAKVNSIKNYVYVGTACSFPKHLQMGPGVHALHESQTYPAEPESGYGWSKLMGEYEATLAQTRGGGNATFNVGLLRFHNVFGPFSDHSAKSSQVIPSLIRKALDASGAVQVWGSGTQYRDFVYVDDVVEALLLVKDRGMNAGVIQIGSARATTIKQLAEEIVGLVRPGLKIEFDTGMPEGDRGRIAVLERAQSILGWRPRTSLGDGLRFTIDWMRQEIGQTSPPFEPVIHLYWTMFYKMPQMEGLGYDGHQCEFPEDVFPKPPTLDTKWCRITHDRTHWPTASSIMFYIRDINQLDMPTRRYNQPWIFHAGDSPDHEKQAGAVWIDDAAFMHQFNYTMGYRLDHDFPWTYNELTHLDLPTKFLERIREPVRVPFNRRRSLKNGQSPVLWVASNCWATSQRHLYVEQLAKHVPVDCLGNCLRNGQLPPGIDNKMPWSGQMKDFVGSYKFYLAMENSNCAQYVTEKLFQNSFEVSVIPIADGPPAGDSGGYHLFNPDGRAIINIDDYPDPRNLAALIKRIDADPELFASYFEYRTISWPQLNQDFVRSWNRSTPGLCMTCQQVARDRMDYQLGNPVKERHVRPDMSCLPLGKHQRAY